MTTFSTDEVIERWPVRSILELSGKARSQLMFLNKFKAAVGHIPGQLAEPFQQGTVDPEGEGLQNAINELVNENPFAGYFSVRVDPLQHPMMEMCLQQTRKILIDMCWTVVFNDYNKHLKMSIEVFNFLQLKVTSTLNGCMVAGYRFNDDDEMMTNGPEEGNESFS